MAALESDDQDVEHAGGGRGPARPDPAQMAQAADASRRGALQAFEPRARLAARGKPRSRYPRHRRRPLRGSPRSDARSLDDRPRPRPAHADLLDARAFPSRRRWRGRSRRSGPVARGTGGPASNAAESTFGQPSARSQAARRTRASGFGNRRCGSGRRRRWRTPSLSDRIISKMRAVSSPPFPEPGSATTRCWRYRASQACAIRSACCATSSGAAPA